MFRIVFPVFIQCSSYDGNHDDQKTDHVLDAKRCINCGICLASCPTYKKTFSESQSPRGRLAIYASDPDISHGCLSDCLQCGNCQNSCPVSVKYLDIIRTVDLISDKEILHTLSWLMTSPEVLKKDVFAFISLISYHIDKNMDIYRLAGKVSEIYHLSARKNTKDIAGNVVFLPQHSSDDSEIRYIKKRYSCKVLNPAESWFIRSHALKKKQFIHNLSGAKDMIKRLENMGTDTCIVDDQAIITDLSGMSNMVFLSLEEVI